MKALILLPFFLVGCITQTQEFTECRVVIRPGKGGKFPSAVVLGGQIAAKPVGIDAVNPAISAAPNVNSPNSNAKSGDVTIPTDKKPLLVPVPKPKPVPTVPGADPAEEVQPSPDGG